jgi:long-subunit acyl-CoA synthetase (AMP-forming)
MTGPVINHIVRHPPSPDHQVCFARLFGTESYRLREVYDRAGRVAARLLAQGVKAGDRIGIHGANSLEWVLLDLAALRVKAVTCGFDPGKFVDDPGLSERYELRMLFTDRPDSVPGAVSMSQVRDWSETADPVDLPDVEYGPKEYSSIKFTSGSTGTPKGVPASVGGVDNSINGVQQMFAHGPGDDIFVFLPLSLLQQRYWIYSALRFGHDVTVTTYEAAFATLGRARPTVVMGVPGFFESAQRHIGRRVAAQQPDDLVAAVRAETVRLFGDRIRYLWTGSAPANPATLRFFNENGLPIYEGYGSNEVCIASKNYPGNSREGSVGKVVPGKEVIFDEDGVISIRSDCPVTDHYLFAPPAESEKVFRPGGVVRTGDLGYLDSDGYLYIRGRADDVIVLANGKKVIVRPIEEQLRQSPAIGYAVVFCPSETHLVAVLSPATQPADEAAIEEHVARTNGVLTKDEQVSRVVIAREPFTIENDMLASQFKPKRRVIFGAYRSEILKLQEGSHV